MAEDEYPSWNSVTTSEKYQALPPEARAQVKTSFFRNRMVPYIQKDKVLKDIGVDKMYERFMQQPDDSGQGRATSLLGSAVRGVGEMVPGSVEGAGALLGSEGMRETGKSLREGLEGLAPVNPIYQEDFTTKAAGVLGQVGGTLATGGVGGMTGKVLGGASKVIPGARIAGLGSAGLQGAAEGANAADQYGMTGGDAYLRTLAGLGLAVGTEALPFGQATELATPARLLGAAPRATNFAKDVLTESAEETTEQAGGNLATTALAPEGVETPGVTEGVLEAAALGGIGGAAFGGINALTAQPVAPLAESASPPLEAAVTLPNGTVINAGAPSVITPEFLDGLPEADLIEAEKAGYIKRPPPITAPAGATPAEQAVIDDANAGLVEAGDLAPATAAAVREADAQLDEEVLSAVTTENTEAASEDQSEAARSGVLTKPEEGSIPSVTSGNITDTPEIASPEIQPIAPDEPVIQQPENVAPITEGSVQEVDSLEASTPLDQLPTEQRREELIQQAEQPLPEPTTGDPVVTTVNGNDVIGTVTKVNDDGTADVDYSWNGEDYAKVQSLLKKIRRPARSLAEPPKYTYTQEQNSRKAQRFGIPTEPGIHIDAGPVISKALENIAKDTAVSPMLRAAARALGKTNFDGVDLRIDADARRKYAGYYLKDQGINEIGLNLRYVARGNVDAVGTLVHEALHHATLAKVRDPQPGIEQESVEALGTIIKRIKAYAGLQEKGKKFDYELSNIEEFISALFTRPDFQNFLASIPDTFSPKTSAAKFRSVLSEIFRIIAQLVTGFKVQKGSTMEQALASSIILFDTPQRTIETTVESAADTDAETRYMASQGRYTTPPPVPFYTASSEDYARNFGGNIIKVPVYPRNTLDLTSISADADDGGKQLKNALQQAGVSTEGMQVFSDDELAQALKNNLPLLVSRLQAAGFDTVRLNEYVQGGGSDESLLVVSDSALNNRSSATFSRAQDELAQAASIVSGQTAVTTHKGLSSLMRPSTAIGIPSTGPRGLSKLFATKPQQLAQASIGEAYKQAVVGKSSQMVPIREVYEKLGGSMTPEQFVAQVEAEYNAGRVLLEMPEQASTQTDAGVFVVPMAIGPKATSMMVVPENTQFSLTDDSMASDDEVTQPMDVSTAYDILTERFGPEVAQKLHVGVFGPVAGAEWEGMLHNGEIGLNLRFMPDEQTLILKAEHEMAHAVWNDPTVRSAWRDLRASMPADLQAQLQQQIIDMGYSPSKVDQETLVRYLEQVRASTPDSAWQAFWDAVINAFRRLFGADPDERTARVVAAQIVAAGEAAVARGLPTDSSMFEQSRIRETGSRFASPDQKAREYEELTQAENDKLRDEWLKPLGTLEAARLAMRGMFPKTMQPTVKVNIVGTLLTDLVQMSVNPALSEDERTVARSLDIQLGKFWHSDSMSRDAARAQQQRAVQNAKLFPFAPILENQQILDDRAEKIVEARFTGGTDQVVARIEGVAEQAGLDADERVERILNTLIGTLGPKETARGALAKMFRGNGQRDQIIEEVAQALMTKSRGNLVAPERRSAIAQLVSSLKGTLSAQVKGEKVPAPDATLPDLLTRAFVNQVAEGKLFEESWVQGRQKVLDMLIDMELDKTFRPLEKQRADLRARLTFLEAGSDAQRQDSTVERQQLADQIKAVTDSMKTEKARVDAMTPQFEAQRDALMPASVSMSFDPAASSEAIARAFEQAGYTAELATGLDKSGKRTLSVRDAVRDKQRAVAAVMKVLDESMTSQPSEWQAARPTAQKAVEDTLAQWQKDLDKKNADKLQAEKEGLLGEDSRVLEKLVNTLRDKVAPGMRWKDIFYDLPANQDARKQALLDRLSKHEALRNLTPEEQDGLAEEVNKIWQSQRQKLFKKELKKAGVLGEKSLLDRAKVFDAAPRMMRLLNLGVFSASSFREAIAKEYGLRVLTHEQATKLRTMAAAAWNEPEGVLRNVKLRELLGELQTVTKAPWSEIVNSYWTASVLSGLRTQFDTYMAVINGFGTNLIQAGAAMVRARSVQAGLDAHLQWWNGLTQGIKEAVLILAKGDTSFLKRFSEDVKKGMEGEQGFSPVPTGERLWKEGNLFQKWGMAPVMIFTGRLMTAADHINNTATTQGAMAVARALHPDIYGRKVGFTSTETADARKQAVREALGGREPATYAERRLVDVRTREILNGSLTDADRAAASETGDIAAFQNDPTGFFGAIYSAVKAGISASTRQAIEIADDPSANAAMRAMCAAWAAVLRPLTGTQFMRFGFNFGNDIIRYFPGSYLLDKLGFFGKETSQMQRDLLLGKNVIGFMIVSTLATLFQDDDEEKDGEMHIEGDWSSYSREEQARRRSAGLEPFTLWNRSKDGDMWRVSYKQWATMGLFATVGGMQDERRGRPEEWAKHGTVGHYLNAAITGLFQVQNAASLRGLGEVLSSTSMSGNSVEAWKDKFASLGANYVGGLVPTAIKDVAIWNDPRNFKADGVLEQVMRQMPMARRYVNDGRPQLNLLGDEVQLNRMPWSRMVSQDKLDPAYGTLAKLIARGHDLQQPSTSRQIFKDGKKVPLETLGRDVAYEYEKAVTTGYKQWLTEDGEALLALPVEQADKVIENRSRTIRDVALRQIQARVNK